MRFTSNRRLIAFVLALAALAATAGTASASRSQFTVMQDDALLQSHIPATRDAALDEMRSLGVRTAKVALIWRSVAPAATSSNKPGGFDGTNPAAYGNGFDGYRALVDAIKARGMNAWLILITPAPAWAAPRASSRQPGVYDPDTEEFGDFAEAAGRVFPDVTIWSLLNEPNHQAFIEPQVKKSGVINSAIIYRKLAYEGWDGLAAAGHAGDQILFGGMAPRASAPKKGARSVWPIAFLRQMLCLDDKLRPVKGRLAKDLKCTGKFRKIPASGFAYHPYTGVRSPLSAAPTKEDALIGQLPRLYKVLDRAYALRRIAVKKIKLWDAEFGYQSRGPDPFGAKISLIPGYLNLAEYISWKDRRVVNFHQYQLVDEPPDLSHPPGSTRRYQGFQAGLRFADNTKKPGVYNAFQMPIVVEKVTRGKVRVWGGIRAFNGTPQTVEIQVKSGSGFKTAASVLVTNSGGYFQTNVALAGAAGKTWRTAWNGENSRSTKPVPKVKPKR